MITIILEILISILTITIIYLSYKLYKTKPEIENWDGLPWNNKMRIKINLNGYLAYGYTTIKQPKPILKPNNKLFYPPRYFAYCLIKGKPTVLVEERAMFKDGSLSKPYFTKLKLKITKTNIKWTHNDRTTDLPFLCCSIYTNKDGDVFKPSERQTASIRLGDCFHVNKFHKIIVEKIPETEQIVIN